MRTEGKRKSPGFLFFVVRFRAGNSFHCSAFRARPLKGKDPSFFEILMRLAPKWLDFFYLTAFEPKGPPGGTHAICCNHPISG